VTGPDVALRSIMPAFEGVIPATIATAFADGTPNITYISVARFLDEERIAISNQFFGKTTGNLDANPFLAVRVVEPQTMLEYELDATRLRSERAGELFDSMPPWQLSCLLQSGPHDPATFLTWQLRAVPCGTTLRLQVDEMEGSSDDDAEDTWLPVLADLHSLLDPAPAPARTKPALAADRGHHGVLAARCGG
jgi:hypothetical protein